MPSSITHELIADEARRFLPKSGQTVIASAPDYYYLGAQGPDILFFYRPFKRGKNLGKLLHRGEIHGWFSSMLRALKTRRGGEKTKCLAYALGYASHYAADAVFHTFVYNYLRSHTRRFEHQQMESDWDVYFLTKLRGVFPLPYRFPFDTKKLARAGILAAYMKDCAGGIRQPIDEDAFRRALANYGRYLKFFHGRAKGGMFSSLERILGFRGVSAFYPRRAPNPYVIDCDGFETLSEGNGKNADELFDRAVSSSAELASAFLYAKNNELSKLLRFNFEGEPLI